MKDVNKVFLIGRLGNDPVQRETKNGMPVSQFSLATSRRILEESSILAAKAAGADIQDAYDGKGADETTWHRVVVWGKQAEACRKYLVKGQACYIEGMVRTRKYNNKDGAVRIAYEIHADNVSFLGRSSRQGGDPSPSGTETAENAEMMAAAEAVLELE